MSTPADKFATPRIAAGALFVRNTSILLVRKTYGNKWDIPGGYVDRGESPASACSRELYEETGLHRTPVRLLVQDWAPTETEGDKLLFVFDCGTLESDEQISVDGIELDGWLWVAISDFENYLIPRLTRRLRAAYEAHTSGHTLYLENGQVTLGGQVASK